MRLILSHKSTNDKGQLLDYISAITFYADPTHRIKVMAKPLHSRVTDTKDPK